MTVKPLLLEYRGFGPRPAVCLVVVEKDGNRAAVADLVDNDRTSVTNAMEEIAKRLNDEFGSTKVWHYIPWSPVDRGPGWYQVDWRGGRPFRWPVWERVNPDEDPFVAAAAKRIPDEPHLNWAKEHELKTLRVGSHRDASWWW